MSGTLASVFSMLTDADLEALSRGMATRAVARGEVLIAEGSVSDALHLLSRGSAAVRKDHLGAQVDIADLEEGEIFGEISFLLRAPASASVAMTSDGEVKTISGADLQRLAASREGMESRLYQSLAKILARRLVKATRVSLQSFVGG